jgi:hypothetical protein
LQEVRVADAEGGETSDEFEVLLVSKSGSGGEIVDGVALVGKLALEGSVSDGGFSLE